MMPVIRSQWPVAMVMLTVMLSVACASAGPHDHDKSSPAGDAPKASAQDISQWTLDLQSDDMLTRRAAVRKLARAGDDARDAIAAAAENTDLQTRRLAVQAMGQWTDGRHLPLLKKALHDEQWLVRQAAVQTLARQSPRTDEITALLEEASRDANQAVWQAASAALWPFSASPRSVRDRPDLDFDLRTVQTIPLPAAGWKFKTDPKQDGHTHQWFDPKLDDSGWADIQIERIWNDQGFAAYSGVAWYRLTLELPPRPAHDGVDLVFDAVDNAAWVWVNGQFIAGHDIGPDGWNKTFKMDVSHHLQWGQKNQITIRVRNGAFAGGIYKPVYLDILRR